jgi:hypothetical protein
MFNGMGGKYAITRKKAAKVGIKRSRVPYSKKTKHYYIVSAREMWKYVTHWFGKPHQQFPKRGRYKTEAKATTGVEKEVMPVAKSKKGIVAFEKIYGYSGSGHVDIFNGETLSDSDMWYPSKRIKLWYV